MRHPVYAMDTYFYNSLGSYDFGARCEMLKELGYDATYLTLWSEVAWNNDLKDLSSVKTRYGLDVASVYVTLDIAGDAANPGNRRILEMLESVEGCDHIELAVRSTAEALKYPSPAGFDAVRRWLGTLLAIAERRHLTLSLYPHMNFWVDRIEIAARLCREINHPSLRLVFCGYHWYAVDGTKLAERIEEAAPYLRLANLCGSRRLSTSQNGMPATIEPLDQGDLDNFAVLGLLRRAGYLGMVGFQGFGIGGDVYPYLKRSLAAFRSMEQRLDSHPRWAQLRPCP